MYQQVIIVGNLGRDPEMRYTASGVPVTSFSVAVSKRWTGQDGQKQEKTTWFRVTAWRQLAEICSQYLTKGRQVMVIGEIEEPDVWTDREGNNRASLELTARDVKFLAGGDSMSGGGGSSSQSAPIEAGEGAPVGEEDIPF